MHVVVIGAGIVGLSSAYFLNKAGYKVSVIDKNDLSDNCSYGNAGLVAPSHVVPLAAPKVIAAGIRWMLTPSSPFYIQPRIDFDLLRWGWRFYRSATREHVERSVPVIRDISLISQNIYAGWAKNGLIPFDYSERGLLMLYKTEKGKKNEGETADLANKSGIEAQHLSVDEIYKKGINTKLDVQGGFYYPGDTHLYPNKVMQALYQHLDQQGISFVRHESIRSFDRKGKNILSVIGNNSYNGDLFVIAGGAFSSILLRKLGIHLAMQDGKGYSVTINNPPEKPHIPAVLSEAKVAVTPMGNDLRIGGTLEFSGFKESITMSRVKAVLSAVRRYYPDIKIDFPPKEKIWYGFRPCSFDGLPFIGRVKKYDNLVIATGHSMLGLSLGAGTGKLVSEVISGKTASMELSPFDPER